MKVVNRRGSYQHSAPEQSKKAEGKRDLSPLTPFREKGRVKKLAGGYKGNRLSRGRAGVRALISAEVSDAVRAFAGTEDDRRIWAAVAWRVGAERFHNAVVDKIAEDCADGPAKRPAAAFQAFLNNRFPKGGAA